MADLEHAEDRSMPKIVAWLGGLGALPFAAGAVLSLSPETQDIGRWMLIGYGAVILSFLGGVEWGVGLAVRPRNATAYLVSIVVSLVGWVALLLDHQLALMVLGAGFVAALIYDFSSTIWFALPGWFIQLRTVLTCAVLLCFAAAFWPFVS